jgi:hypothetical protein
MIKKLMVLGMLGLAIGACDMKRDAEDREENEVKVSIEQVPPAVRATLQQQAPGITTVDKESDNGKVVYEADAMIGGQNYEIKVAEDGKLISKKVDNEADEKKGEEKNDKGGEK